MISSSLELILKTSNQYGDMVRESFHRLSVVHLVDIVDRQFTYIYIRKRGEMTNITRNRSIEAHVAAGCLVTSPL